MELVVGAEASLAFVGGPPPFSTPWCDTVIESENQIARRAVNSLRLWFDFVCSVVNPVKILKTSQRLGMSRSNWFVFHGNFRPPLRSLNQSIASKSHFKMTFHAAV
ncbi:hypothetical protein GG681_12820 [Epibacterium sp. SM1969]|uniref:Uncharacterized protein n=1 Tax=Tritonibacter aquimaris TaxID=2663379 RepID=A0A844AYW7_9RHOB|nr:hypothetical protein [Tritonibacter aquimaris]MQY43524.1 hypothetical protein [Tritonibacter aquimaris]